MNQLSMLLLLPLLPLPLLPLLLLLSRVSIICWLGPSASLLSQPHPPTTHHCPLRPFTAAAHLRSL